MISHVFVYQVTAAESDLMKACALCSSSFCGRSPSAINYKARPERCKADIFTAPEGNWRLTMLRFVSWCVNCNYMIKNVCQVKDNGAFAQASL